MLAVFPFCHKDIAQMREVLRWVAQLDPSMPQHSAMLVASQPCPDAQCRELVDIIKPVFGKVSLVKQSVADERGWPQSCNSLFRIAASAAIGSPFWWNEADCIPLCSGWLDRMGQEYASAGKPFMGARFDEPWPHLTGCAIYPPDVARYNSQALHSDRDPWDVVNPEATLRHAHITNLLQHVWADPATQKAYTFPSVQSLSLLRSGAVLFHRCKDDSLIRMLRANPNFKPALPAPLPPRSKFTEVPPKLPSIRNASYYHSGNLGDIIYALLAIMLNGGGRLIVGPVQKATSPCSNPVVAKQFELLKPLLEVQPYISGTQFSPFYVSSPAIDLNSFRNQWLDINLRIDSRIKTLAHMHCYRLGVADQYHPETTWLSVPSPEISDRIVVSRSLRHRNWFFPWKKVIQKFGKKLLFIGLHEEHERFQMCWGDIEYRPTANFLEMARVIAGARGFVGNQSFPCAMAIGMGSTVLQETFAASPDCIFPRDNFFTEDTVEEFLKRV